jgi:hypothetical protein
MKITVLRGGIEKSVEFQDDISQDEFVCVISDLVKFVGYSFHGDLILSEPDYPE